MSTIQSALVAIAALASAPIAVAQATADTLPSCNAWLENRIKGRSLSVDSAALDRLRSAGVTIEPGRRMRAEGYPWEHLIRVALPPSYHRDAGRRFPVLWVTDGSLFFSVVSELVTSCAGTSIPEMIVVAIGATPEADQTKNEVQSRRTFDYSPNLVTGFTGFGSVVHNERAEATEKRLKAEGKFGNDRLGGAPRFLGFLVDDVRKQLGQDYRMADDHTLFGHSGGGLFCTYALVARPAAFARYICGSPSLAAGDYEVFRLEERFAQQSKDLVASVFFGAGEAEILAGNTWGLVSSTARMVEILKMRAYPSLKLSGRIFPGENHGSVIPLVISWGLRSVSGKGLSGAGAFGRTAVGHRDEGLAMSAGFAVPARLHFFLLIMTQFIAIILAFGGVVPTLHERGVSTILLVAGSIIFVVVFHLGLGALGRLLPTRCRQCRAQARFRGFGWWPFSYHYDCRGCGQTTRLELTGG